MVRFVLHFHSLGMEHLDRKPIMFASLQWNNKRTFPWHLGQASLSSSADYENTAYTFTGTHSIPVDHNNKISYLDFANIFLYGPKISDAGLFSELSNTNDQLLLSQTISFVNLEWTIEK